MTGSRKIRATPEVGFGPPKTSHSETRFRFFGQAPSNDRQPVQVKWSGRFFEARGTAEGPFQPGNPKIYKYIFNISGEVDAEASKLVRATFERTRVVDGVHSEVRYTLMNVPLARQNSFEKEGPAAKDHVTDLSYRSWWLSEGGPGTWGSQQYADTNWSAALPPLLSVGFSR